LQKTFTKDLYKRPGKKTTKEIYRRDLKKRPKKATNQRDLCKRLIHIYTQIQKTYRSDLEKWLDAEQLLAERLVQIQKT